MRIAVWYNLHSGGGKRALSDQIKGLIGQGHAVEVWSPPVREKEYLPLHDLVTEHVIPLHFDPTDAASNFARLFAKNRNVYRRQAAFEEHCDLCCTEINQGGFDILLAHPCFLVAISPIGQSIKIPSVMYSQEPKRPLYEAGAEFIWRASEPSHSHSPKRMMARSRETIKVADSRVEVRNEWKNVVAFDQLLVNSYFSREAHWRAYGIDSKVCYLGIDAENFPYRRLPREDFVIGLGTFSPAKNQTFVIEALSRVPEPRPKLVWVGNITFDPAYLEGLKRLAESLHVEFEVKQMISDEDLVDLLNRASMMLSASRLEPFGYAPLEANACGTPVIAVAEGGVRETVIDGENGLLVENDPEAMAAAIVRLRDNPTFARELGENARKIVESKWNLSTAANRLEQCLQTVVTQKREKKIADRVLLL